MQGELPDRPEPASALSETLYAAVVWQLPPAGDTLAAWPNGKASDYDLVEFASAYV